MTGYYAPPKRPAPIAVNVEEWGEMHGWRPVDIQHENVAMNGYRYCCGELLERIAWIASGKALVSIGCCDNCGYVGYLDRPTQEWFDTFYRVHWRNDEPQDGTCVGQPKIGDAKILEIGCGNGDVLAQIKEKGVACYGIEPALHRAAAARRRGLSVYCGSFDAFYGEMVDQASCFNEIMAIHVLEHAYDPASFIRMCAALQRDGGRLMIGVPNAHDEPSMGQLFFLPHLHSFTPEALILLLHRNGYGDVCVDRQDITQLWVTAWKRAPIECGDLRLGGFVRPTVAKLQRALAGDYMTGLPWRCWNLYRDQYTWSAGPETGKPQNRSVRLSRAEPLSGTPIQITMKRLELMVK